MSYFSYKAIEKGGTAVSGVLEAPDRKSAIAQLAQQGRYALDVAEGVASQPAAERLQVSGASRARLSGRERLELTRQLATALKAGLGMLDALEILKAQQVKASLRGILERLAGAVSSGHSLSEAMAMERGVFSDLYVSMVRVGETGGILDQTMEQLLRLLSREERVKSNLKNAAAYPVFVLCVGLVSVVVVLVWILPKLIQTLGTDKAMLPLPTRMLMSASDFLLGYGWIVALLLGGGVYAFLRWKSSPAGKVVWDGFKLKAPMAGPVLRSLAVGRFARTLGSLTHSGIPILEALAVVRNTLGNEAMGVQIDKVAGAVKAGGSVAEPLAESGLFGPLAVQIVAIGEQTGKLDEMLLSAADSFEEQADAVLTRFGALLPAVMILALAAVIFFIIAATLLPVVGMDLGAAF